MAFFIAVAEFTPILLHECVSSHGGFSPSACRSRNVLFMMPSSRPSLICESHNGMCLDRDSLRHEGDIP